MGMFWCRQWPTPCCLRGLLFSVVRTLLAAAGVLHGVEVKDGEQEDLDCKQSVDEAVTSEHDFVRRRECRIGSTGCDWIRVQDMVRRLLFAGEEKLYHPIFDYLWLPEFEKCAVGAATLRLFHLYVISSGHLFLEYFPFAFEVSVLRRVRWSSIAWSGWGSALFALLDTLSQDVCSPADVRRGGSGIVVMPGVLSEQPCEGPASGAQDPRNSGASALPKNATGFARAAAAAFRAAGLSRGWEVAVDHAQRALLVAAGSAGTTLVGLLRTRWPVFAVLRAVAERCEHELGPADQPCPSGHAVNMFEAKLGHQQTPALHPHGACNQRVEAAGGFLASLGRAECTSASPSQQHALELCELVRSRAAAHMDVVVVGAASRSVGCAGARPPRMELDIALFVDRLDLTHDCDTWLGTHFLRPRCVFRIFEPEEVAVPARVLSGLSWLRPMKTTLVTCELPANLRPRLFAALETSGRIEARLEDPDFLWRVPFALCASAFRPYSVHPSGGATAAAAPRVLENVTICTEPIHSVRNDTAHLVQHALEYHSRQGAFLDVYDLDGSAAATVAPFVAAGRARYFPHFPQSLSPHVGTLAAAARREPADGCSCGLQEMHCLMRNRGKSRWVVPRLDPDEFFARASGRGVPGCRDAFRDFGAGGRFGSVAVRRELAAVFVGSVEFGGRARGRRASPAFVRYIWRSRRSTPRWTALVNPENALSTHLHSVRPRPGARVLDFSGLKLHHYLEAFGHLERGFIGDARTDHRRHDDRLRRHCRGVAIAWRVATGAAGARAVAVPGLDAEDVAAAPPQYSNNKGRIVY